MKRSLVVTALLLLGIGLAATSPWDELRDSFTTLTTKVTAVEAEQAAIGTKVEGLSGAVAELKVNGQNAAAEIAKLSVRVTALEKPVTPPPPPPPPPIDDPELLTADDLEYLGWFLLPKRTKEDSLADDARLRQYAYTEGIACAGPNGMFVSLHEHGTYVAEVSLPEPSKTTPQRAEYLQLPVNVGGDYDNQRTGGLLYDAETERLIVNFYRFYNVAHSQYGSIAWGPADLSRFSAERKGPFKVTDPDGALVDFERVSGGIVRTPFGLTLVNQRGKHDAKSDGPALSPIELTDDGVVNYREILRYPRSSRLFPYPKAADGLGGWNETCSANGFAVVGRTGIFACQIGLATGLDQFAGQRDPDGRWWVAADGTVYYGGPGNYPVEGVAICKGAASKGYHAPPYKTVLFLYDIDEIANAADPSHPMPYAMVDLSTAEFAGATECGFSPGSIVWLPERRWLVIVQGGQSEPRVHVLKVNI